MKELTAAEAIYGFCGWLTIRKERTIMSGSDDAAPIVELIKTFLEVHKLEDPTANWDQKLKVIKEKK